jgi:hypothetical protein
MAPYGVSWAGEEKSTNWFDTAREYTERWHHQQQIRLAVGHPGVAEPGILTRELYHPVLDCFMRALPFTYHNVSAPEGTAIRITVSGECGGSWNLLRGDTAWALTGREQDPSKAEITIPQEIAWRIFSKGIDRASAQSQVKITGEASLALHVLSMVSIVSA